MDYTLPVNAPIPYDSSCERIDPQEDETAEELLHTLREISDKTYEDTGLALRSVHAKSHGLLQGTMTVLDLEPPFSQGLFAEPRRSYPVLIRLST